MDYNGTLLDTACNNKINLDIEDITCVRNFKYLTHNQKELPHSYLDTYEGVKIKYTKDKTFVLVGRKMLIIDDMNNIEKEIKLEALLNLTENQVSNYNEILKIEGNTIWFFTYNTLIVYDFKIAKTLKKFDLKQWNVHQAILDNRNLWFISRKDGEPTK
jgi:hypothetical protein